MAKKYGIMNKEHTYLNRLTAGVAVARSHSMSARRAASAPSNPASAASDPRASQSACQQTPCRPAKTGLTCPAAR